MVRGLEWLGGWHLGLKSKSFQPSYLHAKLAAIPIVQVTKARGELVASVLRGIAKRVVQEGGYKVCIGA
jgi:hypothetical protein